ncbi:MAG: phospholipid carrier-dependent glycosyltransferase [Candidatus Peregrinibacteria bacterium]|nr:phospholipid carrier-dependent glycosyltransferase [Candidatus Peregrinibacteria bacterium]
MRLPHPAEDPQSWLLMSAVVVLSCLTLFFGYGNPPNVFWDENYHIASAQKYLNGVYFMEQHPPLGKLLIAAGEKLLNRNPTDDNFLSTDYGTDFPVGFSFEGYRFFPALLAWLTAPVLFLIFLLLTRSSVMATLLSFFYVFDNALIVHLRGAMLEGPLLFFSALTILAFLLLLGEEEDRRFQIFAGFFGVAFALIATTKVLGLIFLLLVPALLITLWPNLRRIVMFLVIAGAAFLLVYCAVWKIHFALGRTVNPSLPDQGYYQASVQYKSILTSGRQNALSSFPVMLRDSLKFVSHYNRGTPKLDLCKEDENGSPFFFWPFGARSINYRWETPDSQSYRYLYLQVNPVVWWSALIGIVVGVTLLLGSVLLPLRERLKNGYLLLVFLGLYGSYMLVMSRIDRVMYLYHYFIPLLLSFIIFALVVLEIERIGRLRVTHTMKNGFLLTLGFVIFLSYQYYRPLTYYEPLSDTQMQERAIMRLWELRCVRCARDSMLAYPKAP